MTKSKVKTNLQKSEINVFREKISSNHGELVKRATGLLGPKHEHRIGQATEGSTASVFVIVHNSKPMRPNGRQSADDACAAAGAGARRRRRGARRRRRRWRRRRRCRRRGRRQTEEGRLSACESDRPTSSQRGGSHTPTTPENMDGSSNRIPADGMEG